MQLKIVEKTKWATTAKGNDISLFASPGYKFENKSRPILFIGGVHGDEPEGVHLATELLAWLQHKVQNANYTFPVPWLLIPNINPDGYNKAQRTNANGVDLNRNYPASNWQAFFKKARYYPGPFPSSEIEVSAVVKTIKEELPRLIIHFHSWKPCIVYTGDKAYIDAKRLSVASGYDCVAEIGYPTPGSLGQFAWKDLKIPVICIEEQEGQSFSKIWPKFENAFEKILSDESLRDQ